MDGLRRVAYVSALCLTVVPALRIIARSLGEEYVIRLQGQILAFEADLALQNID